MLTVSMSPSLSREGTELEGGTLGEILSSKGNGFRLAILLFCYSAIGGALP